jgi:hypothetical protein
MDEDHKELWARGNFGIRVGLSVCLSANVLTSHSYSMDLMCILPCIFNVGNVIKSRPTRCHK